MILIKRNMRDVLHYKQHSELNSHSLVSQAYILHSHFPTCGTLCESKKPSSNSFVGRPDIEHKEAHTLNFLKRRSIKHPKIRFY